VSFSIPQVTGNTLWKVLNCIDVENFRWHIEESQTEVWNSPTGNKFFEKHYFPGHAFLQKILCDHYIIFLKLQAQSKEGVFSDIRTYEEFLESECQLLLLIYDCESLELYTKDPFIAKKLYDNALEKRYFEVNYITDCNDSRTRMNVL